MYVHICIYYIYDNYDCNLFDYQFGCNPAIVTPNPRVPYWKELLCLDGGTWLQAPGDGDTYWMATW